MRRIALAAIAAIAATTSARASAPERPNVVVYLVDTLRADVLQPYGYARPTSPFLARLAREGVVFERCYAQAPWTKPSMGSLLTSRYAGTHRLERLRDAIPAADVTLVEAFARAGYETAGFSANPIMGRMGDYARGFEFFEEGLLNPLVRSSGTAAILNRSVARWLRQRARRRDSPSRPLFLYVHAVDPHWEYEPAPRYLVRFADPTRYEAHRELRRQLSRLPSSDGRPDAADTHRRPADLMRLGIDPVGFMAYEKSLYDADVRAVDDEIARLVAKLRRHGILENALVVVTSDHGEEFLEHGGVQHGTSLYDEAIRVPLILWDPRRLPAGTRVRTAVESIDLFPTLASLLHVPAPPGLEGRDLTSLVVRRSERRRRPVFSQKRQPTPDSEILQGKGNAAMIVRYPWKLIVNYTQPRDRALPDRELFDLQRDPGERVDLLDRHPAIARKLETELWRTLERTAPTRAASASLPR